MQTPISPLTLWVIVITSTGYETKRTEAGTSDFMCVCMCVWPMVWGCALTYAREGACHDLTARPALRTSTTRHTGSQWWAYCGGQQLESLVVRADGHGWINVSSVCSLRKHTLGCYIYLVWSFHPVVHGTLVPVVKPDRYNGFWHF